MNNEQLTFGLVYEKINLLAVGDVVRLITGRIFTISQVDENINGAVYLGRFQDTGTEGIILAREIARRLSQEIEVK